jgi:hypothetical protein
MFLVFIIINVIIKLIIIINFLLCFNPINIMFTVP